jgi:hypothetical protein
MSGGNSSKEPDRPLSWYHLRWVLLVGQSRIRAGTPRHCGQTFGQPEMVGFCKLAMLPLPSSPGKSPQWCSCTQPFGQLEMVGFCKLAMLPLPSSPRKSPQGGSCIQPFGQLKMVGFCKLAILPLPSSPRKSPQGGSCIQPFGQPEMVGFLHATLATESPTAAIAASRKTPSADYKFPPPHAIFRPSTFAPSRRKSRADSKFGHWDVSPLYPAGPASYRPGEVALVPRARFSNPPLCRPLVTGHRPLVWRLPTGHCP